jgi:tRNA (cmo5U34)-methyltransferase
MTPHKSTVDEIRQRFDNDVERFSNLETGQSTTMDAPIALDLIVTSAAAINPQATSMLDIGCGAGNYSLKMMEKLSLTHISLIDLSRPMLERAQERISKANNNITIHFIQGDIREIELCENQFDVITAAAVFHHLRTDDEWESVFTTCVNALKPGGSIWIADLIQHADPAVQKIMRQRYADYLAELRGPDFPKLVFDYIEKEDTPRPLLYQVHLLHKAGIKNVEILHKNSCFAAFGGAKH